MPCRDKEAICPEESTTDRKEAPPERGDVPKETFRPALAAMPANASSDVFFLLTRLLVVDLRPAYSIANSLPGLNFAVFFAGILIFSFVVGLMPTRSALVITEKVPKPTNETFPPSFNVLVTDATNASNAFWQSAFAKPDSAAIALISSALFIMIEFNRYVIQQLLSPLNQVSTKIE